MLNTNDLKGSNIALPTPFRDGEVDEPALRALVDFTIKGGTGSLLVTGSTGEPPTLTDEEHRRVIEITVDTAAKRVPVVAGCGTNSTRKVIHNVEQAKAAGADAVLLVAPYYNKPNQEGIYQHFKAVHDAVDMPIILYNHPGRCVIELSVDTVVRLAKLRNVIGMKESGQDLSRVIKLRMALGSEFMLISGDEPFGLAYLTYGGSAVYNILGTFAPAEAAEIYRAWNGGDRKRAAELNWKLMPISLALFCDVNPVPLKYLLSVLGRCTPEVRLPLTELSEANKAIVRSAMEKCGIVPTREGALARA